MDWIGVHMDNQMEKSRKTIAATSVRVPWDAGKGRFDKDAGKAPSKRCGGGKVFPLDQSTQPPCCGSSRA